MNLIEYAKEELKRIGMIDSGEPYNDVVTKAILDLLELFASQGHSGFTAPYTARTFHRLAMYKPLTPLTGEDDEWHENGDVRQVKIPRKLDKQWYIDLAKKRLKDFGL